jgi:hypothetical protein
MSKWKWIWVNPAAGERIYDVGILADGTVHNPRGYPEDVVRAAVAGAEARRHERRSKAAIKAGATRRRRQEKRVADLARRVLAGHGIGAQSRCAICSRHLDDPESIGRGVGSEC